MKKFLKILLSVIFIILILIETESFAMESLIIKTLSKEYTSKKISGYVIEVVIKNHSINELEYIEDKVRTSKYIDNITKEYLNVLTGNLVEQKNEKINIEKELRGIVYDELKELPDEEKKLIIENLSKIDFQEIENKLEINLQNNYFPIVMTIIKAYNLATKFIFKIIIMALIIISFILLCIINNKKEIIKYSSINLVIVFIVLLAEIILLKMNSYKLTNHIIGRSAKLNTNLLIIFATIYFTILMLLLVYNKVKKKKRP